MEIVSDEESTRTEWSENRIPIVIFRNRKFESTDNFSDSSRDKDLARNVTDMNIEQKVTHSTCPLLKADGNGPSIHENNNASVVDVTTDVESTENTKSSVCTTDNASNESGFSPHSHFLNALDSSPQDGAGNNHPGQTGSCLSPGDETLNTSDDLNLEIQSQSGTLSVSVSPEVVGEVTQPSKGQSQRKKAKKKPKIKPEMVNKEEEVELQVELPATHTWVVFLRLANIPERFVNKEALVEIIADISGFKLNSSVIDVRPMDKNSRLVLVSVKCPTQALHDDFLEVVNKAGIQACSKCSGTDQKGVKTTTSSSSSSSSYTLLKFKVSITFGDLSKEHMGATGRKTVVDYLGNLTDMCLKEEHLEADKMNGAAGNSLTFRACFVDKDSAEKFFGKICGMSADAGFTAVLMTAEDIAMQDIWDEIFDTAQGLADQQRKKLEEVSNELQQIQNTDKKKWTDIHEFDRKQAKAKPLRIKLRELEEQNEEFTHYVNEIQEKVWQLKNAKDFKSEADRLRTDFKLETVRFSSALPMYAKRSKIVETVLSNRVSIILGDTGSGKSTQIIQYLHYAGLSDQGLIVCTQPRKVAAVSLATRVAEEMGTRVGQLVGYQVGMQTKRSPSTKILYVTDHVLLNGCLKDKLFTQYACVVIDEAHERSIYTDLLLGFIKRALTKRDDLRVLITSATINPQVFTRYFGSVAPPPVLDVPGRVFPVDVSYERNAEEDYVRAAVNKAVWIQENEEQGDVLVFLTNPLETEKACKMLRARYSDNRVLALECHGRLQLEEQQRVFVPTPPGKRKVVFATNSAETSVTIPGIKYVIDTGRVREMTYDPKKKMSVLSLGWTTQSSANQRKGRAGRTDCGHCFRLYGEVQYNEMNRDSVPEILRINLAQGLLKLLMLGITDPESFDFVESPDRDSIAESLELLEELGAYSAGGAGVTETGRRLAQISMEPRLGAVVLRGIDAGVGYEAMILAAVCSAGGSVFFRGGSQEDKLRSDRTKTRFCDELGDAVTGAMIYKEWDTLPMQARGSWCKNNNINGKTMRCAQDILREILHTFQQDLKITVSKELSKDPKLNEKLATILLGCYHSNLARYLGHERLGYCLVRNPKETLVLHPSSSLLYMGELPKWVVYEQSLTTSDAYMTNVTYVDESWITDLLSTEKFDGIAEKLEKEMPVSRRINGLGRQCIAKLTEQKAQGLQDLEKRLKQLSPDNRESRIHVHLDSNKRCLVVFADRDLERLVVTEVHSTLNAIRMTLREEMLEERIRPGSDVRFVLGSGLAVRSVLMPGERRQLAVLSTGRGTCDMRYVRNVLQSFGEIESYTITPSFPTKVTSGTKTMTSFSNSVIGYVTFKSADDAASAVATGRMFPEFRLEFSTKGSPDSKSRSRSANFSVKVEVWRRPLTGVGHVQFRSFYARNEVLSSIAVLSISKRLAQGNILEANVSMTQNRRNPDEAILKFVPEWATPDIVRQALVDAILNPGLSKDIMNIFLTRTPPPTELEDRIQVNSFQELIRRELVRSEAAITARDYEMEMTDPKPKDFTMFAYLKFDDQDKADLAMDVLDGASFGDQNIEARLDLKATFIVSDKIHDLCIGDVRAEVARMKRTSQGHITVQDRRRDNGSYLIQVEALEAADLRQVRPRLESVIHGQRMDLTSGKYLQMKSEFAFRKREEIQRMAGVRIRLDDRQQSVFVYGKMESVDKAKRLIEEYLNRTESSVQKELDLRAACYPRGVMKSLVSLYGLNLEQLKALCGAFSLDLNLKRHSIKFNGSKESYDQLKALVGHTANQRLSQQGPGLRLPDPDPVPDCAVCLTGVDYDDCYVTESCGHFYCTDCCCNLIKSGLANNDLPIRCAVEDCPETLALKDVQFLVRNFEDAFEPAVRSFVAKSEREFTYCSTPDCPSFYRRTKRQPEEFVCSICHASLCTVCDATYHPGTTCEQRSSYEKADVHIKDWLRRDPAKRTLCPNCEIGIEKNGGCNHVECTSCKAHICWKCKKFFRTSDSCYQHLRIKHGGINDDEILNDQIRHL